MYCCRYNNKDFFALYFYQQRFIHYLPFHFFLVIFFFCLSFVLLLFFLLQIDIFSRTYFYHTGTDRQRKKVCFCVACITSYYNRTSNQQLFGDFEYKSLPIFGANFAWQKITNQYQTIPIPSPATISFHLFVHSFIHSFSHSFIKMLHLQGS